MELNTAKKILKDNGIQWNDYFDLNYIEQSRDNWINCEDILTAINRIKLFITKGI